VIVAQDPRSGHKIIESVGGRMWGGNKKVRTQKKKKNAGGGRPFFNLGVAQNKAVQMGGLGPKGVSIGQ